MIAVEKEKRLPQHTIFAKPLPAISENYVKRPEIQNLLTKKLLPSTTPKRQPRCILYGLGGSGKTQLASSWISDNRSQ
jgi:Cdc6-like AAA superfamily ATPase